MPPNRPTRFIATPLIVRHQLSPYLYLAKASILNQLAYRLEAFAGFGLNLIPLASLVFLWKSAFQGNQQVAGVTQDQMVAYSILAVALKDVFYFKTQESILAGVQTGQIAIDFLRPYNVLCRYLSEDIATSFTSVLRRFVPLLLFSAIFITMPLPSSASAAALFLLSCVLSYAILWSLSALTGLIAFWAMEVGNLGMVKDALVRILSGSIVPLWFFPEPARKIFDLLPFRYTFQTPLGIFIGKTGFSQALQEMMIQVGWATALGISVFLVWHLARRRLMIQGG